MTLFRPMMRRARRIASTGGDAGVTLIEVVVAMVVMLVLATSVLGLVVTAQKQSVSNRNRVAASNLAAREIELVREQFLAVGGSGPTDLAAEALQTNPHPLTGGTAGDPLVIDGTPYTVKRLASWSPTTAGVSACQGGGSVLHPTLVVNVQVTWPGMGTVKPITNTAVLSPERAVGLGTTAAFAAITVTDSLGKPMPLRNVTVFSGSESVPTATDASGCAVAALSPGTAGSSYSYRVTDAGYVDIAGTEFPERTIGTIKQGTLNADGKIQVDKAASVTIQLTGVSAADAVGATVSLYQSVASGPSIRPVTVTGLTTTVTNLWPTNYAAFFGSTVPATLPTMVALAPGGTGVLSVPFLTADFVLTGVPSVVTPGTQVVATSGSTACTDSAARVIDPAAGHIVAGTWSFWLRSTAIGCSEGPSAVALAIGDNPDVAWAPSTLTLTGAPAGPIWAAPGASGGACSATNAQKISDTGVSVGPVQLAAGSWYIFAAPDVGGPGAPCLSAGLVSVPYGASTTYAWPLMKSTVRVSNVAVLLLERHLRVHLRHSHLLR